MKYPKFSHVFADNPGSDLYNTNVTTVTEMTTDSTSDKNSINNIKKEPLLMFLSVDFITKDIQCLHHVTVLGGKIAIPDNVIVTISDFGASSQLVQFNPDIFAFIDEFRVLTWVNITGIDTASVSTTIANTRNVLMKFHHIITISLFLTKFDISSTSKKPEELMVEFIAAITTLM